jgi:hypothetical protein
MQIKATSPEEYLEKLSDERRKAVRKLREVILENLPKGFEEVMSYGMIGYVVPHALYPSGYHVDPKQPLPFINIASQKNHIAIYHLGIYSDPELMLWFKHEYANYSQTKLDIGKSCIRFRNPDQIPYVLLENWCEKLQLKNGLHVMNISARNKSGREYPQAKTTYQQSTGSII